MYNLLRSKIWIFNETAGILSFEIEYGLWIELQEKKNCQLRNVLQAQMSDTDLRVHVEGGLAHFSDLFRMKAEAAKVDVFHVMHGIYRSPVERFFLWIGGFRPSEIIQASQVNIICPSVILCHITCMFYFKAHVSVHDIAAV